MLEPCPGCGQVAMWEKAFWIEYACGGNRDPKIKKDLEGERGRQKGKDDF